MADQPGEENPFLISYITLRRAVGIIGIVLPFALVIGKALLQGPGLQSSVSAYYYTLMRDVLVGSLCAIAVFLMTYKGYDWYDDMAGNVAGIAAIGVAFFPTTPERDPTAWDKLIGGVHLVSATLFFLALAYFCLALFKQTNTSRPTPQKLQRNLVYSVCGYTILGCLALIAVIGLQSDDSPVEQLAPVFWLEALAIVAFGFSWLIKGETILSDEEPSPDDDATTTGAIPS